jgi:ribosomal protein S12 methylthiotransferase
MSEARQTVRRFFLDPFGCVKNQVDAETMMAFLREAGWEEAKEAEDADLIIVNSCGFIESAKKESLDAVFAYRGAYPEKKILLAGCLSQRYAGELSASLPEADLLFGNRDLSKIAEAAAGAMEGTFRTLTPSRGESLGPGPSPKGPAVPDRTGPELPGTDAPEGPAVPDRTGPDKASPEKAVPARQSPGSRPLLSLPGSAYVKISEGCDNRCAFCAIPLIRGPLISRPLPSVLDECRTLLDRGIRELCLIGQDLGAYGRDGAGAFFKPGQNRLAELFDALSGLSGSFWIRLLYIHPDNFPLPLLEFFKRDRRFLPYFDLPFQHGSESLLRAMNRRGGADKYLRLLDAIREALPDAVIRSTFLVGFPGETEEDFDRLLEFQKKAAFDWLGVFCYSREEDTPAYTMKGRVPKKIAALRKRVVEEAQIPISEARMDRFIGRTLDVLVEEEFNAPGAADPGAAAESSGAAAGGHDTPGAAAASAAAAENSGGEGPGGDGGLYLGRLYCQAPEVDGAAVITGSGPLVPGSMVRCRVTGRAGIDMEVRPLVCPA